MQSQPDHLGGYTPQTPTLKNDRQSNNPSQIFDLSTALLKCAMMCYNY